MLHKTFRLAGRPLLVTRLNVRQYGHQGLEMAMSFALARRTGADVCFLRPKQVVSEAMFQIEPDDVRVVRGGVRARFAGAAWGVSDRRERVRAYRGYIAMITRREVFLEIERYMDTHVLAKPVRGGLKEAQRGIKALGDRHARAVELPLYYQRRLLRERVAVHLRPRALAEACATAARCGLDPGAPVITLHVREAGWKFGHEMQDAKPGARDDSTRNARIASYFDAIDDLVARGFTIVRLGDPSMTPIHRAGVVDLATSPQRTNLLELYCMLRSTFFISGEAGPVGVSYLTNTPLLTVNATDPISSYPIRDDGMFIPKDVVDRATGRPLMLDELVGHEHLGDLRSVTRFQYIENTSEDIRLAALEMLAWVQGDHRETVAQARFRELAARAGEELRASLNYVRKWGSDQGFIGDGRVCRFYAERHS